MKWAALAVLGVGLALAGDVLQVLEDALTADEEADQKASKAAKCWCDKFQDTLDSRNSGASSALTHLRGENKVRESQNSLLRMQLKASKKELAETQSDLQSSQAMQENEVKDQKGDLETNQETLKTIRSAIKSLPKEDSSDSARTALRGVEQTAKQHVEEIKEQLSDQASAGLVESKEDMLSIAKKQHERKFKQLADGLAESKILTNTITVFEDQAAMDTPLRQAVKNICSELESAAERRTEKRQLAQVEISRANAVVAQAAVDAAGLSLVRKHGRQVETSANPSALYLEEVTESNEKMLALEKQTQEVQQKLESMLSGVATSVSSAAGSAVPAAVKEATAKLDSEAKSTLAKLPKLFEAVRSATAASEKADIRLLGELKNQEIAEASAAANF